MPLAQLQSWAHLRPQPEHAKTAGSGPDEAAEFVHPTDALIAGHTHWREPGTGRILPLPTARNAQGRTLTSQTIAANDAEGAKGSVRIRYYHCDQIGTPRELTRPTGEITWQATYKAWGNTQTVQWEVAQGAAQDQTTFDVEHDKVDRSGQQPLRFQGQYFDEETGLHYNRFRYYDPDSGRFISHDPIGLLGGENTFGYVPNPSGWVDPSGLIKCTGLTKKGQNRATKKWRAERGPAAIRQHHLIPQAMMKDPNFMSQLKAIGIADPQTYIHRQIAVIDNELHTKIHCNGWNDEFKDWFKKNPNFTKSDLQNELKSMMRNHNIPSGSRNFAGAYGG